MVWASRLGLALLSAAFFWMQLDYCRHLPLVMDELQSAGDVYRLRNQIPYVDFPPYKNVIGYYMQLPFLLLGHDLWSRMMAVKLGMAAVTAVVVFGCGWGLMRVIQAEAVVLATALLFTMSTFLERAAELRVDMLTSLAGLVSFVLLLSRRYAWAGLACGVSFLISQKGVYFFLAGGLALASRGLVLRREQWRWREPVIFGGVTLAIIGVYLVAFAAVGSFDTVAGLALVRPAQIALAENYKNLERFWMISIQRNPYFYSLALLGIGGALERARRSQSELDCMIFVYAGTIVLLCVAHKQPWPYFFVLLLPTLLVPIARAVEQLAPRGATFWAAYLLLGLLFPLYTRIPIVLARDSGHQRYTIELAQYMLRKRDTYLAGTDMVYTRAQSPKALAWLDKVNLDLLRQRPSSDLIAELQRTPPKLVIGNYRIDALPIPVRKAIRDDYDHLWASIWLYAPTIRNERFNLAYTGEYRLDNASPIPGPTQITIDDKPVQPGSSIQLTVGEHVTNLVGYKLHYLPPPGLLDRLDIRFRMPADMFPAVYDY